MNELERSGMTWRWWLFSGMMLCAALLIGAIGLSLPRTTRAQDLGLEISKSLVGGSQVQVGQILEFTIRITNTGDTPITELQVVDEFVGSIVAPSGEGPYARPADPPLSDTTPYTYDGNQRIVWDLLGGGQVVPPGGSLAIRVRLRAIRPTSDLQIVNRARIERAIRSNGQQAGGGEAEAPARPSGARMPMTKSLGVPLPVQVGLPITFTIVITNDGAIDLTDLPLRDIYNPAALQFVSADPPASSVNEPAGLLVWDDLLELTGRGVLRPGEAIRVTTVYIALQNVQQAVNRAEVSGARDEYGNALEANEAEVPIFIVGPAETATSLATATAEVTATPLATATIAPTATEEVAEEEEEESEEENEEQAPMETAAPRLTEVAATLTATAAATATSAATAVSTAAASETVAATVEATGTAVAGGATTPATLPATGASGGGLLPGLLVLFGGVALGGMFLLRRRG